MNRLKKYIPLFLILALGLVLRFYHNLDISIWHDEAFSALMIRYPWGEMFYRLGLDVHPPAYYAALRLWHYIFGDSVVSLRGFSVLFGVGTIWAGWLFVKEAFKAEKAALWAALLIAINPFQILHFTTEARMYTFGGFFALTAGYFLVKALNNQKAAFESSEQMPNLPQTIKQRKMMWWHLIGFILSTAIIIQTHYYLFFTAAALGFYGLVYLYFHNIADKSARYKKYVPLLLSFIVISLSFLPWLKQFIFQVKQVGAGYWIPPMNVWSIPSTFWDMLLGFARDINNKETQFWLAIVMIFSIFMLYKFLKKTESFHKWLVVLAVLAPFAGSLMFLVLARLKGSSSSVYLDRYFLFASLYFSIALALWFKEIKAKSFASALFIVYVFVNLISYLNYWKELNVRTKPGMQAAAKFLHSNVEPKHHVFVGTTFEFFNYKYYWKTGYETPARPRVYTGGRPYAHQMSHVDGVAMLEDADLVADLKTAAKSGDTVWLIWTYAFGSNKPDLPLNWIQIDQKEYPDVRPYAGASVFVSEYKVN